MDRYNLTNPFFLSKGLFVSEVENDDIWTK